MTPNGSGRKPYRHPGSVGGVYPAGPPISISPNYITCGLGGLIALCLQHSRRWDTCYATMIHFPARSHTSTADMSNGYPH